VNADSTPTAPGSDEGRVRGQSEPPGAQQANAARGTGQTQWAADERRQHGPKDIPVIARQRQVWPGGPRSADYERARATPRDIRTSRHATQRSPQGIPRSETRTSDSKENPHGQPNDPEGARVRPRNPGNKNLPPTRQGEAKGTAVRAARPLPQATAQPERAARRERERDSATASRPIGGAREAPHHARCATGRARGGWPSRGGAATAVRRRKRACRSARSRAGERAELVAPAETRGAPRPAGRGRPGEAFSPRPSTPPRRPPGACTGHAHVRDSAPVCGRRRSPFTKRITTSVHRRGLRPPARPRASTERARAWPRSGTVAQASAQQRRAHGPRAARRPCPVLTSDNARAVHERADVSIRRERGSAACGDCTGTRPRRPRRRAPEGREGRTDRAGHGASRDGDAQGRAASMMRSRRKRGGRRRAGRVCLQRRELSASPRPAGSHRRGRPVR